MRHFRGSLLLASFLAGAPLLAMSAMPAQAQFSASIGFDSFHGTLSGYGDWLYSDRWGDVWRPTSQDRDPDWRPYWAGHWASTREYGWTWISDEGEWGDIAYHYGRWVNDPDDGWLWLPGYVWSPAWVVWRSSGPDVGWMPMPPDDGFLRPSGISISIGFGDWNDTGGYYGYSRWYGSSFDQQRFGRLWTFVPGERLSDPGYRRYALPRTQTINIIQNSRNITNYTVVNNTIINRSVNTTVINQGGRAPQPVAANTVLRSTRWVTPVNQGEQIQNRARQERPRGDGRINSAPPPTPEQIRNLSTRAVPAAPNNAGGAPGNAGGGRGNDRGGPRHLFSQANAQELQARGRGGQPNAAAQPNAPQPNAQPPGAQQPGAPQNGLGNAAGNGRNNNREGRNPPPAQQPGAQQPGTPLPQPGADERGPRNRDNNARDNAGRDNNGRDNNGRGAERPSLPGATTPPAPQPQIERAPPMPPAAGRMPPSNNPPTEDRGNRGPGADRPPRALPGQPPTPPAAMEQRPQAPPREQPREQMQREQSPTPPAAMEQRPQAPPREQPREQMQREQPQRMPDRAPERAAPPPVPREVSPPPAREQAPPRERAQPPQREQAQPPREQPRGQARPDTPPPDQGQARGNGRDRPDDNNR